MSQNTSEIGLLLGGTYYQGDINTSKLFQSPFFAGGVLYRHNFSTRYSLRGSIFIGKLISNDANSKYTYQLIRNHAFSSTIVDYTLQCEFNFLEYLPNNPDFNYSPYISTGVTFVIAGGTPRPYQIAIPLGIGFKYSLSPRLSTGIEWTYRKTFTDFIDSTIGLEDDESFYKQTGYSHNNDWYAFAGIFLTYRFSLTKEGVCPAYGNYYK
ncbi:MAG TPA: hypothetical protein DDX39_04100 [Bacteroidales bacterium]|nr:MAG: hypothetical protein A2W98_09260 [Bacteroidetes bacterium GWF2_33_38]OFY75297.1 MAG: hypothetical protein A2265_10165 [Bacteroidetes bacterium RIFOXYA12_FULL_33_9]OFY88951.1 MAG: hypothetical protein A2236_06375 [Bacteroidetes bacterium RIFOXYA2_FULL_33_7]HBF87804.1 hypothetical protein [Bacteroidales bacterium]